MNHDQIKGRATEGADKVRTNRGDAIDRPEQQGKGMARERQGKVQKTYGDANDPRRVGNPGTTGAMSGTGGTDGNCGQ